MKVGTVADCEGYIRVARGVTVTQVREGNEPDPPKSSWNIMAGTLNGPRRYTRTEWQVKEVCSHEEIRPNEGEVEYDSEAVDKDGHRYVAYISGDDRDVQSMRFMRAMAHLDAE